MTTLALPVAGPAEATSSDCADCASLALNAALRALSPGLPYLGRIVPDNGNAQQIQQGALSHGISGLHADIWSGDPLLIAQQWMPRGAYIIVGVNCTPDCVPMPYDTGIHHWLTDYSTDAWTYNCWHSTFQRYANLSQCHNLLMGNVVLYRDGFIPVESTQPTGGTLIPEDPDAMTNDTALGLARLVADSLFGRPGLGIDTVNAIASDIVSKGLVEAMDKWGAVAQQNGEVGLVGRVANRAKIDQTKP